jgi:broad specificity phosphatase PhoE
MKILIIRHAEPDYSIDSLTPKGFREADILSERLSKLAIEAFYCSPMGRAMDTARPTLAKMGREAEVLPWLREFAGKVMLPDEQRTGIPWNLKPQYWTKEPALFDQKAWLDHPLMTSGNVREVWQQTITGIDQLLLRYGYRRDGYLYRCSENRDLTIALFCHFALGTAILAYLLGIAAPPLWMGLSMPPSSVTTMITEERFRGEVMVLPPPMAGFAFFRVFGGDAGCAAMFRRRTCFLKRAGDRDEATCSYQYTWRVSLRKTNFIRGPDVPSFSDRECTNFP